MSRDDDKAATHLRRLGVNPATVARLRQYAETDDMSLRDFACFVLRDYAPPQEIINLHTPHLDAFNAAVERARGKTTSP